MKQFYQIISNQVYYHFSNFWGNSRSIGFKKSVINLLHHYKKDSLFSNSFFLIINTALMALFGFFFWMFNARLYSSEDVGIATALISLTNLITNFSLLGLNTSLIRYLPKTLNKNRLINIAFTLVIITTTLFTIATILSLQLSSPKLLFIRTNISFLIFFIILMPLIVVNALSDSIFISFRSTKYILLYYLLGNIVKITVTFLFVSNGSLGIYLSYALGILSSLIITFIILIKKFKYQFSFEFDKIIYKEITKFSISNYISNFIGNLSITLLPLIIINNLGSSTAASFYFAIMIANLLYIIPSATTQSFFAEGSYNDRNLNIHLKKSILLIFLIMTPLILITLIFGKYILLLFGKEYANDAFVLLQLLAVAGFFVAISNVFGTALNIMFKLRELIIINIVHVGLIISLTYLLLPLSLLGVGLAWLLSKIILSVMIIIFYIKSLNENS